MTAQQLPKTLHPTFSAKESVLALTRCGNKSGSGPTAIIPSVPDAGICHGRGFGCGKPPGPARGRGSPPRIATATAVNRPMSTLVVMTALPPLRAPRTHPNAQPRWRPAPRWNAAPRIVGQVALCVQCDQTSPARDSRAGIAATPGFSGQRRSTRPPPGSGARPRARGGFPRYPLTSGPARSIETLTMTRRSRSIAAR